MAPKSNEALEGGGIPRHFPGIMTAISEAALLALIADLPLPIKNVSGRSDWLLPRRDRFGLGEIRRFVCVAAGEPARQRGVAALAAGLWNAAMNGDVQGRSDPEMRPIAAMLRAAAAILTGECAAARNIAAIGRISGSLRP